MAPNPGTSEEASSEEMEGRTSAQTESGRDPTAPVTSADDREGIPAPDADGDLSRQPRTPCAAAKGGEHGHELKILRSPRGTHACVLTPVSPRPRPWDTARRRRDGVGR